MYNKLCLIVPYIASIIHEFAICMPICVLGNKNNFLHLEAAAK